MEVEASHNFAQAEEEVRSSISIGSMFILPCPPTVTPMEQTPSTPTLVDRPTHHPSPANLHHTNQILKLWAELGAFEQSLKLSEGRKEFTFYDGPPFATGLPHYGQCMRLLFGGERGGLVSVD